MDSDVLNPSCCKKTSAEAQPPLPDVGTGNEDDDELNALLSPQRAQMSKRQKNSRRKVQWNDRNGNKLVEVLEFQPSDSSDSDAEEDSDSCLCIIM
ncbi:hypothetical protein H6P81_011902 [Aristolochia fimbriata]|uniref:Uncharacterized protein n=1 Tax=Aristolochia fimbriata TaxID=158543 RepID=A0AAV7EAN8_ARIFI|nr:hypothetical protein H6P81_011902 [Aristolochia fimbriata]